MVQGEERLFNMQAGEGCSLRPEGAETWSAVNNKTRKQRGTARDSRDTNWSINRSGVTVTGYSVFLRFHTSCL